VELIVVAVILTILATIGFVSYEKYLVDTRDSKRLAQLSWLRDAIRLSITKWPLPKPDDFVEIRNNGTPFLYQGYAWENFLESISYSASAKDPFDKTYYTYLLSRNTLDFQLLGFLEEYSSDAIISWIQQTYAVDYTQRFPQVMGRKLGILLEQDTNTPLQEMQEYSSAWYMDLNDSTTNMFDAYVTDTNLISGSENDLIGIIPFTTCKKIKQNGDSVWSGIYNINPSGLNPFEVYCDMDMDNGGWTLVWRSVDWFTSLPNFGWIYSTWNPRDDSNPYSLWQESVNINFSEIMYATYEDGKDISFADKIFVDDNFFKSNYDQQSVDPESADHTVVINGCEVIYKPDDSTCSTYWSLDDPVQPTCTPCDNYRYDVDRWGKFSYNWYILPWRSDYENWLRAGWIYVWSGHPYSWKQWMIFVR